MGRTMKTIILISVQPVLYASNEIWHQQIPRVERQQLMVKMNCLKHRRTRIPAMTLSRNLVIKQRPSNSVKRKQKVGDERRKKTNSSVVATAFQDLYQMT